MYRCRVCGSLLLMSMVIALMMISCHSANADNDSTEDTQQEADYVDNLPSGIFTARCYAYRGRTCMSQDVCHSVCLSVCLSVCPSHAGIVSKRLNISLNLFSSDSHTVLLFPYQTSGQYPDGTPITGASNAGIMKHRNFRPKSHFISKMIQDWNKKNRLGSGRGKHRRTFGSMFIPQPNVQACSFKFGMQLGLLLFIHCVIRQHIRTYKTYKNMKILC